MADPLRHPGPPDGPRVMLAQSRMQRRRMTLAADVPLLDAIQTALDGADSAWIEISDARGDLRFVLPDRSRDGVHAAWYSDTHDLPNAPIHRAGIVWGRRDGRAFGHCHGLWGDTMGHLLLDASCLTRPAHAEALIFPDARFDANEDAETGFTLFKPRQIAAPDNPGAAILRLGPHIEMAEAIQTTLARLDWPKARILGLGSLNTARFDDGALLDSHATEFLVRPGPVTATDPRIELDIVGIGGTRGQGLLCATGNTVCVTAELILTLP